MDTKEVWSGSFGDEYTRRNRVQWSNRNPFWKYIIKATDARSVFEFGAGAGWNLSSIGRCFPDIQTSGYEINEQALFQAEDAGLVMWPKLEMANKAELSFTAGVLIHISPQDLEGVMKDVISKSYDWVLSIEYHEDEETEIEYRGQYGLIWKRNYKQLYEDLGLEFAEGGYAQGFDRCEYNLFRR